MLNLRKWYKWQRYCNNSMKHKLFVLFGFIKSPTYEMYFKEEGYYGC